MNLLADNVPSITPPLKENYHYSMDTTTIIIFIICCLVVVLIISFLCFWIKRCLSNKKNNSANQNKTVSTEDELQVLSEYQKLDSQSKDIIKNTIQILNSKSNED